MIIFHGNMIMPRILCWSRDRTVNRIPLNLIALLCLIAQD